MQDATRALSAEELATLTSLACRVFDEIPNTGSVRVRIVDDEEMTAAHDRFTGQATTTDVLTFDLAHDQTDLETKVLDTDLIVCLDEAQRQASTRSHTRVHELLLYTIHGVLHCLGYDDHDHDAYERMHAREDELLTKAGIGALFSTEPAAAREDRS